MSKDIVEIKVERIPGAYMPKKAHDPDAGWDITADDNFKLYRGEQVVVETGLRMAIPKGYFALVSEKSGLALEGISIGGRVIDSGYRGELCVIIRMFGKFKEFKRGDKIAQLLILPVLGVKWVEVKKLDETDRGTSGFGSTGR